MQNVVNPYQPPQPTRPTDEASLHKTPVLLVILFAVITCGIYVPIWYWRRRHALNLMAPEKGVTGLCVAAFIILTVVFFAGFASALFAEGAEPPPEQQLLLQILNLIYLVFIVALGFRVKGILEANYPDRISGVGVFFLNLYYLQYKINRLGRGEPQTTSLGLR